jgi:hypothetical protein
MRRRELLLLVGRRRPQQPLRLAALGAACIIAEVEPYLMTPCSCSLLTRPCTSIAASLGIFCAIKFNNPARLIRAPDRATDAHC